MKKKSPKPVKSKRAKRSKSDESNTIALRELRRTQLAAQKIARLYGMPIHFWGDGKGVAEKP
jgi:hypothetical protein